MVYFHITFNRLLFGRNISSKFHPKCNNNNINETLPSWLWSFPLLEFAKPLEIVQETGETMFVPSGWHHSVENLLDTCSINANWCNAYNLEWLYAELQQRHNQTSEVFSCATFLKMLSWKIKLCKENYVQSKTDDRHLHTATQNTKNVHILFDLKRICSMATRIKKEMPQNFLNLQEEVCRIVVETNDLIQEIC